MTTVLRAVLPRDERLLPAALVLLPLAAYLAARLLGYVKLLQLGLLAVGAAVAAATFFVRPRWGIYFVLFFVYTGAASFAPVNAAVPATFMVAAAVVLALVRGDRNQVEDAWFWWANALFVLAVLQSMLFARDPMLSLFGLYQYVQMLLGTYLIAQLVRTAEQLRRAAYAVFAGAVVTVLLGVVGLVFGVGARQENVIEGAYVLRFVGAHENPNKAGAYMCSALPLGLFGLSTCRNALIRGAFIAGVIVLVTGIFATLSRSVMIPFAVIAVATLVREIRSRRVFMIFVLLVAVVVLLTPRYYWGRLATLRSAPTGGAGDWSLYTRWLAMTTAWELFLDHPWTGVGLGNFIVAGAYRMFLRLVVHNTYLEILVGTGIPGLVAYLGIFGAGTRALFRGARRRWVSQPPWVRSLCFYFSLSAVSMWLSAMFMTQPFRYPLWLPVTVGLVVGNLLRRDRGAAPA